MNAGFFKRLASFIIDFAIIFALVFTSFRIIGGPVIRDAIDGYEEAIVVYNNAMDEYLRELDRLQERLETNPSYTQELYEAERQAVENEFNEAYYEESQIVYTYWIYTFFYFAFFLTLANYLYALGFKGYTLGRRLMKLRLSGRVTWWTLFVREVLWKSFFWIFTFSFGLAIDFGLIAFTRNRKTVRDYVSGTRVILDDVVYPF